MDACLFFVALYALPFQPSEGAGKARAIRRVDQVARHAKRLRAEPDACGRCFR